jgi:hypothetical protein
MIGISRTYPIWLFPDAVKAYAAFVIDTHGSGYMKTGIPADRALRFCMVFHHNIKDLFIFLFTLLGARSSQL